MSKKNVEYEQKIGELTLDLQRVRADFENYRKNVEREKDATREYARAATVLKLLSVVDDIDRAVGHIPEELAKNEWTKGIVALSKKLDKSLESMGVARVIASGGTVFNPELHEAVGLEDGDGEKEVIAEEMRSGYTLDGIVIRPAMVRVAKK